MISNDRYLQTNAQLLLPASRSDDGALRRMGRRAAARLRLPPAVVRHLAIAQAARERCDLVWVIDGEMPRSPRWPRSCAAWERSWTSPVLGRRGRRAPARVPADGILALADPLLRWTADVAARLELPFRLAAGRLNLTDKHAQRVALRAGGLPVPEFRRSRRWRRRGLGRAGRPGALPALVKPRSGGGEPRCVRRDSVAQAREYVAELERTDGPGVPPLVLEAYLPIVPPMPARRSGLRVGREPGGARRVSHVAITGRFPLASPSGRPASSSRARSRGGSRRGARGGRRGDRGRRDVGSGACTPRSS